MGIVHFVKSVGQKLDTGNSTPTAAELKKVLDSYYLGTSDVRVSIDEDTIFLTGYVASRDILEKAAVAIGNLSGIAAVDTGNLRIRQENNSSGYPCNGHLPYYTVKKDDTLWKIAEKIYGKGKGVQSGLIFDANRPMLTSPNKIYHGQVLRIPLLQH